MIREIYLDLDDTCNTLAMHVLACKGCPVDPTDYRQYPSHLGYNAHDAINLLLGEFVYPTPASLWSTIPRGVWRECPTAEIFPWILHKAARLVGRENVCMATSPTKCPDSVAGKLEWIHENMPSWMHRQFAITPRKERLANPHAILIDDLEPNITRFERRGGHGVLVPRPWNRLWGQDPFEAVERQIAEVFP
jgi:hypothetical protein